MYDVGSVGVVRVVFVERIISGSLTSMPFRSKALSSIM